MLLLCLQIRVVFVRYDAHVHDVGLGIQRGNDRQRNCVREREETEGSHEGSMPSSGFLLLKYYYLLSNSLSDVQGFVTGF